MGDQGLCIRCHGTGKTWNGQQERMCWPCRGTGKYQTATQRDAIDRARRRR